MAVVAAVAVALASRLRDVVSGAGADKLPRRFVGHILLVPEAIFRCVLARIREAVRSSVRPSVCLSVRRSDGPSVDPFFGLSVGPSVGSCHFLE